LIKGNLEVKLPTIWTDEKQTAEVGIIREEKRREEKRREEERRKKKKERRKKIREEKESEERRCRCAKR